MEVNVIYNGVEYIGTVIRKGQKYWLVNIPEIGDRKIAVEDIFEVEESWDKFRERHNR